MNIFVLSENPWDIPKHYPNIHLNKMLLEACQMLCSVFPEGYAPYKRTHYNHPCTAWVRHSLGNFLWLEELAHAMSLEYTERTGKTHKCDQVLDWIDQEPIADLFEHQEMTTWPQCIPEKYKWSGKCPYCGPRKGSIKSNSDGTWAKPLEFLPCKSCNATGYVQEGFHKRCYTIQAYRRYYAAKLRDFKSRGLIGRKR